MKFWPHLLAAAAVGALGAVIVAGPRSTSWPFQATPEDLVGWTSSQSTYTVIGALTIVLTFAALSARPVVSPIGPWVFVAIFVVVLAFTKVAIPESAGLAVLTALHLLKSVVAGIVVGTAAQVTRHSRGGWIALATGMFGGYAVVASQGTVSEAGFVPSQPFSSSVFGEPAWWLLGAAFVFSIAAAVAGRGTSTGDVPARTDLARLVGYAVLVAVVGRVALEVAADAELGVAIAALVVFVLLVDRIAARWEAADARVILTGLVVIAATVSTWNVRAFVRVDSTILLLSGVAGIVVGAAVAAALRRWPGVLGWATAVAVVLLAAVPTAALILDIEVVSVVATAVVAGAIAMVVGTVVSTVSPTAPDPSARALTLSLPGTALLFAAVAPVPDVDTASLAALVPEDIPDFDPQGETGSLSVQGYEDLIGSISDPPPVDHTSAYLMLGVVVFGALRLVMVSRSAAREKRT